MSHRQFNVDEVYGIARELPRNYVKREYVDSVLRSELQRDKHVVIYGSSKQGKTCLRKKCINGDDQIAIQCNNRWDLSNIHAAILKQAGYEITLSEKKTISGTQKIKAKIKAELFNTGASASGSSKFSQSKSTETRELELNPEDVNDVIRALEEIDFQKYIVLEDFHYLSKETQKDFAVALKAFHESSSLKFIVVGVWLEQNRMIVLNGDLTGRAIAVNADEWKEEQLIKVIEKGEDLLNIEFEKTFKDKLVSNCHESVYIVQEACREACRREGIFATPMDNAQIGGELDAEDIVSHVVDQENARYRDFLRSFSDGFQKTELEMYRWLLYPVLTSDTGELEEGIPYPDLRQKIESEHPRGADLNPGNLTQSLQSAVSLQRDKDVKPIIIDYDQTKRRLSVVDRGFLIWLENQEQDDLLKFSGLHKHLS